MTNDEHMARLDRYLTLLLQGGRQEERYQKRQREIKEKFAILFEKQKQFDALLTRSEEELKS
jgi:hypothetical protein